MSRFADSGLPRPPVTAIDAHKGDLGRALLVGGSARMTGAIVLSARAALRSGVGLAEVAVPAAVQPMLFLAIPEAISLGLIETGGAIGRAALAAASAAAARADAVAVGPGLSSEGEAAAFARDLTAAVARPLVVDADGLNAFVGRAGDLAQRDSATIMTPHPGEACRLLGLERPSQVQEDRVAAARELARLCRAVVVLKGAGTIVDDGEQSYVNTTGNAGMATGGSGDVLTGIVTALLAGGMSAFDAARLAVWVHGRAGDLVAARGGARGMLPSDIVAELPRVWDEVEGSA